MSRMKALTTALLFAGAIAVQPLGAVTKPTSAPGKPAPHGNFDFRLTGGAQFSAYARTHFDAAAKAAARQGILARTAAAADLKLGTPRAEVRFSATTGGPEVVGASAGYLTGPSAGSGDEVARNFLRAHGALYGLSATEVAALRFLGESKSPTGLRMVRLEQVVAGMPVFGSETRVLLAKDGRVLRTIGEMVPDVTAAAPTVLTATLSAADALRAAAASVGIEIAADKVSTKSDQGAIAAVAADERIKGAAPSKLVWFAKLPGILVPAWQQVIFTTGDGDYLALVDASSGELLWRKNIRAYASTQDARFSVYVQADGVTPADSPAPQSPNTVTPGSGTQFPEIARTTVSMFAAQNLTASPNGWIDDGGSTTTGNNVDACVDRVGGGGETDVCDIGTIDNNGRPVGNPDGASNNRDFLGNTPRDYTYTPAPSGGNPDAGDTPTGTGTVQVNFRRGAVTQLFYITNWYHDQLYALGFDEAAGNFQNTNFSGQGTGGDRVQADAQDSSGTNNANFTTPPDGTSGRMQMYRFPGPNPDRDGDLDAEIVMHELTHGLSNRLIGNGGGLVWDAGGGMGEGWSDFVALSLLNRTAPDDPDAHYASGAYATYQLGGLTDNYLYGIRRFPYTTDNTVNPMTWADTDDVTANYSGGIPISPLGFEFNGGHEVHNIGEIWALTLWEMRSRIIADPAGANGNVAVGSNTALQIVVDGLKLTPTNPTYTDARDAILIADCNANACANEDSIWGGFADRGLGYGAVAPLAFAGNFNLGHQSIGESFALPHLDILNVGTDVAIDDSLGNNNGAIDPGETIRLTVRLSNPWRRASRGVASATAILTTATAGVGVTDGSSTYPGIAAQGSATGDTFEITVPSSATCGQSLRFTVATISALGNASVDFALRVGTPTGTGAPITYTRTLNPVLAIPDNDPRGVSDAQTITDDYEIADLDFRVDNLSHTFTGDLTVLLKGPNGSGTDLIWLREILFGGGDGDNFVNTVIDDESVNDLNQSADTDAPYTGDWLPAFNSPVWLLFGDPNLFPDPVGQLSRYDGLSTQGTWTVLVADQAQIDTGSLNAWSLIVTPRAFTCSVFVPPPPVVSATKSVSGTFTPGGTVTYTISITNSGTGVQPDNPTDEFTDILPASLTLVSASATSGTANANVGTNTVTWNGSIPGGGGTVNITITATINAGTNGTVVSNQGTVSYDADANGSNETSRATDDPAVLPGVNDPTSFTVAAVDVIAVPTLSPLGLLGLAALLGAAGIALRRRRAA